MCNLNTRKQSTNWGRTKGFNDYRWWTCVHDNETYIYSLVRISSVSMGFGEPLHCSCSACALFSFHLLVLNMTRMMPTMIAHVHTYEWRKLKHAQCLQAQSTRSYKHQQQFIQNTICVFPSKPCHSVQAVLAKETAEIHEVNRHAVDHAYVHHLTLRQDWWPLLLQFVCRSMCTFTDLSLVNCCYMFNHAVELPMWMHSVANVQEASVQDGLMTYHWYMRPGFPYGYEHSQTQFCSTFKNTSSGFEDWWGYAHQSLETCQ